MPHTLIAPTTAAAVSEPFTVNANRESKTNERFRPAPLPMVFAAGGTGLEDTDDPITINLVDPADEAGEGNVLTLDGAPAQLTAAGSNAVRMTTIGRYKIAKGATAEAIGVYLSDQDSP